MTLKILSALSICIVLTLQLCDAKDLHSLNNNEIANYQYAYTIPPSPTEGHDCDQTITETITSLVVNSQNICLTGTLNGSLRFEGNGGKLQISGEANISSFYSASGAEVVIEVLENGTFTSSDIISINQSTDTLTNWGELDINNNLSIDGLYRNFNYAYVKKIVNTKTNTIINADTLINNSSFDNYGFIHNYGYMKIKWGYISNKLVYDPDPTPTLTNYAGAIIDLPENTCYNSGELTNNGTINSKNTTNKNSAALVNTGNINTYQVFSNQGSATINNSGNLITENVNYSAIDLKGGAVTNSGTITSATNITNNGSLTNSASGNIIAENGGFSNDGTFNNSGTLESSGNISNSGTFNNINSGNITAHSFIVNQAGGKFTNDATLVAEESIDNYYIFNNSSSISLTECYFSNKESGAILNNTGNITITDNLLYNKGTINNYSDLATIGIFYNYAEGTVNNLAGGTITTNGSSSVNNYNYDLINYGEITNAGTLQIDGIFSNESTATLTNNATCNITTDNPYNHGQLTNNGNLNIDVHLYNYGTFNNDNGSTTISGYNFYNYSTATNSSNIYIEGNFFNYTGSNLNNSGILETTADIINNTTLTNSNKLIVGAQLTTGTSSTMHLVNGSLIQCYDLYTEGSINAASYYSSIYIDNSTTLKGTITGLVSIFDKDGINSNSATCGADVILEDSFTNNALALDGVNKYLYINNSSALNLTTAGTIEAMIKLDSYNSNAIILNKDGAFTLKTSSSGKQIQFTLSTAGGSKTVSNSFDLNLDSWYHITATWDATDLYLYINGVEISKVANTYNASTSGNTLFIGTESAISTARLEGKIDNIRIWDIALTKDDVWNAFGKAQTSQSNLQLNLTFESAPSGGSYFTSASSSALKAYLGSGFNYSSADLPLDEIRQPFTVLNRLYTDYDIIYIEPDKTVTIENNVSCNSVLVSKNSKLEIPAGFTLTLYDHLYLQSDVDEYAMLLHGGEIAGSGKMYIEQPFLGDGSWEFKTVPATVTDFSQLGETFDVDYRVYYYDQYQRATGGNNSNAWKQASSLQPGVGYIFQFDSPRNVIHKLPLTTFEGATFAQHSISYNTSPNGDGHEGWNLVGNPYNTKISWDKVANRLNDSYIDLDYEEYIGKAIYVYDHSSDQYKYYVDGISVNNCDSIIDPFEAFFIKSAANTSNFQISKSLYPNSIATRKLTIAADDISLSIALTNDNLKDETVIRFSDKATEAYDYLFDAYKFDAAAPYCQVYTRINDKEKLSINSLSTNGIDTTLTLYINCSATGEYTLDFDNLQTFDSADLYLIDKRTNQFINLKEESSYTFTTTETGELERFLLVTKALKIFPNAVGPDITTSISYQDGKINLESDYSGPISVYNMRGQLVYEKANTNFSGSIDIELMPGIYIIVTNNGSKKLNIR